MAHVALKSPGVSGAHRTSMRIGSFTPWYTVRSVSLPAGQIESDQMLDRWWQWSRRRIASIDINSQMMPNVSPRSQNSWEKMTGTRSVSIKIQSDSKEFSILIPQIHHGAQKLPKWDAMDKDCQGALSQAKDVWNSMDQPERSLTFGPRKELKLDESFVLAMSTLSSLSAEFQRWFFDGQGLAVSEFIIHKIKSLNIQSLGNKWSFWQFMNPLRNFRHRMGGHPSDVYDLQRDVYENIECLRGVLEVLVVFPDVFFWGGLTLQTQTPSFSRFNREQRPWMHNFDMEEIGEI